MPHALLRCLIGWLSKKLTTLALESPLWKVPISRPERLGILGSLPAPSLWLEPLVGWGSKTPLNHNVLYSHRRNCGGAAVSALEPCFGVQILDVFITFQFYKTLLH